MSRGYAEYRHWSIVQDCDVVRLSIFDAHGQEFHMTIPRDEPRFATRRIEALEMISEAMAQGCEPGQVRMMG